MSTQNDLTLAASFGHPVRLHKVRRGHGRGAERANLAGLDEVGQCGERLLDVRVGVGTVDLIDVDVVGLQPTQRVLDCGHDPPPGGAPAGAGSLPTGRPIAPSP